jgi:hypothetical protein
MTLVRLVACAALAALAYAAVPPASAGSRTYEDARRGFSLRVPEDFKQTPPKPGAGSTRDVAEFYDDREKYASSGAVNPEFHVTWWVTPKDAVTGVKAGEPQPPAPVSGDKAFDAWMDSYIRRNTRLYGPDKPPMAERWALGKTAKTTKDKVEFQYLELNAEKPRDKDEPAPRWYLFVAKLTLERPAESIVVGFHGYCATRFAKDLADEYLGIVKSFEAGSEWTDSRNSAARARADEKDPAKFREFIKKEKLVAGWKCQDTKNYLLVFDESVDEKLVRAIGEQIEAIRAQLYEPMFPPDRPITAVSVVRICKDEAQYVAYGTPRGTSGVWSSSQKELVFYEDQSNKKDSLRVLYHEAFHQYIYYSVGEVAPHSWFNEGHGDFFAGHDYRGGKFELGKLLDRTGTAADVKREGRAPPLPDWLSWSKSKYYARVKVPLTRHENYSLGWDFIYFLRTTRKREYQGVLDRYFETLKGKVTAARLAAEKAAKESGEPPAELSADERKDWLDAALKAGFEGVDMDKLYKDWMAAD